jgi:kynurenine formamidase
VDFEESQDRLFAFVLHLDGEKMFVELGHSNPKDKGDMGAAPSSPFAGLRAMVFESVGPVRHEVSVPFHDSQVRGAALLIQTGWDQRWGTDAYWEPGPFLGEDLIFRMVRSGVRLVGVDFPVMERSSETRLITTGKIPIVENLRDLTSLPRIGFRFTAAPLEAAPRPACVVRAFAEITG